MTGPHCDHQHTAFCRPRPLQAPESDLVAEMVFAMARPGAVIEEVIAGSKFLAVVAGGRMGLASLLGVRPTSEEGDAMADAVGRTAVEIAGSLRSPSPFSISLGLAALNAGNAPDPEAFPDAGASAEALLTESGRDRRVGVVGQFPFVDRLRERVSALHLFELKDVDGAVERGRWEAVLSQVDVLALTATALLTRQMAWFLDRAHRAKILVLGPSTPFSPVLFDFGVDCLCGSVVTDPGPVSEGIRSGLSFRAIKRTGGIRFVNWSRDDNRYQ